MRVDPENAEQPPAVPRQPMGELPVLIRLVDIAGREWILPASANRWTATHVYVTWLPRDGNPRLYRTAWLPAGDVSPWLLLPHARQAWPTLRPQIARNASNTVITGDDPPPPFMPDRSGGRAGPTRGSGQGGTPTTTPDR